MMQQKYILGGIIALVLIAAGAFIFFSQGGNTPSNEVAEVTGEPAVTITRTAAGYEPSEVTIKKGDIILWKNDTDEYHWPASDLHPTHGIYPEFDPLRPLAPQEDWKFKFDQAGEWKFHDHIRANMVGTVTVTE
jgi:plastocyanin